MFKEKENLFKKLFMAADAVIISLAFILTYYLRQNIHLFYRLDLVMSRQVMTLLYPLNMYLWLLLFVIPSWTNAGG